MASETYEFFKKLSNGEEINRWSYPDKLIYDIRHTRGSNSIKVVITFDDDDDFLDVLNVHDDDRYNWRRFMGNYYTGDLDTYRYEDEWDDGYILEIFNDENKELVNEILKLTKPNLRVGVDSNEEISKFLHNTFDEIEDLVYDHAEQREECIYEGAKKFIMKETDNPFKKFGIVQKSHSYKFETTVSIILKLYRLLKAEDEDLKGLLTKLHEKYPQYENIGSWDDLVYEGWCDDFDSELEQSNFKKHLEKILDDLMENFEGYDFEGYNQLYITVMKLGGFNKWINIPDKNMSVIFNSLDEKTNKLTLTVHKSGKTPHKRIVNNLDELNLTLYQPELFESVKKNLRKFL